MIDSRRRSRVVAAAASCLVLWLALLAANGVVPDVPVVTPILLTVALLIAPGAATQAALLRGDLDVAERLFVSGTLSLAHLAVAGVVLTMLGMAIEPETVLLILGAYTVMLIPIALVGAATRSVARVVHRGNAGDKWFAAASLVALAIGFVAVLVTTAPPVLQQPEVAVLDNGGQLLIMPVDASRQSSQTVLVALRAVRDTPNLTISVDGEGVEAWSRSGFTATADWAVTEVPLEFRGSGEVTPRITVTGPGVDLELLLRYIVGPNGAAG